VSVQRVFFYGSFISRAVLDEHGFTAQTLEVARLDGFDIQMVPLATLVRSPGSVVFGALVTAESESVERLYAEPWMAAYRPEQVSVRPSSDAALEAACYIAPAEPTGRPEAEYVRRIVNAGRELGFPEAYLRRLEAQLP
jgi:AIG2-like family